MSFLDSTPSGVAVLLEITSEPDKVERLLGLLDDLLAVAKRQPGYLLSVTHKSTDGAKIFVYQRWDSQKVYDDYLNCPERRAPLSAIRNFIDAGFSENVNWTLYIILFRLILRSEIYSSSIELPTIFFKRIGNAKCGPSSAVSVKRNLPQTPCCSLL